MKLLNKNQFLIVILVSSVLSASANPIKTQDREDHAKTKKKQESCVEYSVSTKTNIVGGNCTREIHVCGPGIEDNFTVPCSKGKVTVISTKNSFIYDDEALSLFSDKPSKLVVINGGKCTNRSYATNRTTTSAPMTNVECDKVKEKIAEEKQKYTKYWKSWQHDFDESMKTVFSPCFPFCG